MELLSSTNDITLLTRCSEEEAHLVGVALGLPDCCIPNTGDFLVDRT